MALAPIGDELLTVSGTSLGLTAGEITTKVVMAKVQHRSGGATYYRNTGTASDTGTNGEADFRQYDEIEVWGQRALNAVRFIKQSGESDASLSVQYFGEG